MGIINATPDSFSGDGTARNSQRDATSAAIAQAERMIEDGADILDIGGESTRPGAIPVASDEELRRVLPLIERLASRFDIPLSVDTTKAEVARACLEAGASIINDISGGTFDPRLLPSIADSGCGVVLMHLRGTPQSMKTSEAFKTSNLAAERARQLQSVAFDSKSSDASNPSDVIEEIQAFWAERVRVAQEAGIAPQRIALDAGFGFGKSVEENLEILRRGRELSDFGFPTLSAISRKSTLGRVLSRAQQVKESHSEAMQPTTAQEKAALQSSSLVEPEPEIAPRERLWATAAGVAIAVAGGCEIVRVHDVREMVQVARMADAVSRAAI